MSIVYTLFATDICEKRPKNYSTTMQKRRSWNKRYWIGFLYFFRVKIIESLTKTNFNVCSTALKSWQVYYFFFLTIQTNWHYYLCVGIQTRVIPKTFINIRTSWIWNPSIISWFTATCIISKSVITDSVSSAVAQGYRRMSKHNLN